MTEVETVLSVVRIHAGDDDREEESITLSLGSELPSVRNGKLYHVDEDPTLTAKIYDTPDERTEDKLRAMLDSRPDIPDGDAGRVSVAWPEDILKDRTGSVVGLLMREFSGKPIKEVFGTEIEDNFAVEVARNLSKAIDILHEGPHVIGDFHESCVLLSDSAAVTLIDTDLFHISERQSRGGRTYPSLSGRGEYTPPELQGRQFGVARSERDHDLFALAVVIYKLLMHGAHPFDGEYMDAGDPPPLRTRIQSGHFLFSSVREVPYQLFPDSKSWEDVPDSLRDLFARCFDDGHHTPRERPSAYEWVQAIEELIPPPVSQDDSPSPPYKDIVTAEQEHEPLLPTPPRSRRRFLRYGGVSALIIIALVAGAAVFLRNAGGGGSEVSPPVVVVPPNNVPMQLPSAAGTVPTVTPTVTPTPTLTPIAIVAPVIPAVQTPTPPPASTATPTPLPTFTSTPVPTSTATPTRTPRPLPTPIPNIRRSENVSVVEGSKTIFSFEWNHAAYNDGTPLITYEGLVNVWHSSVSHTDHQATITIGADDDSLVGDGNAEIQVSNGPGSMVYVLTVTVTDAGEPTATPTFTPTPTATPTPTQTAIPTATPIPTPTFTPTITPTFTSTPTPSATPTTTPKPLPNLVLERFDICVEGASCWPAVKGQHDISANHRVSITWKVVNRGYGPTQSPTDLRFYADGEYHEEKYLGYSFDIPPLDPGESVGEQNQTHLPGSDFFHLDFNLTGDNTIIAIVDMEDRVQEIGDDCRNLKVYRDRFVARKSQCDNVAYIDSLPFRATPTPTPTPTITPTPTPDP